MYPCAREPKQEMRTNRRERVGTLLMQTLARRFLPEVESASAAREFVGAAVRDTGIDRDEALLLTSELVNNAILHAHSDFEVRVDFDDFDALCVSVVNHSPELLPLSREPSSFGGRGLSIVDRLANAWGFESQGDAKWVWFRLASSS